MKYNKRIEELILGQIIVKFTQMLGKNIKKIQIDVLQIDGDNECAFNLRKLQ